MSGRKPRAPGERRGRPEPPANEAPASPEPSVSEDAKTVSKSAARIARPAVDRAKPPAGPRSEDRAFPIVGIGASAGGLEAVSQLLEHLDADTGLAFVLVQHLDPTHPSLLSSLLARRSPIPVVEATDGLEVAPNHVYVIPPNHTLAILRGVLHLLPRTETRGRHMSVDYFFRSLADDQGARAVGVVLSGADSDGSLGVQAIKAAGGLTFAQDEATAKHDSMPRSAVATGAIDLVLPPAGIAEQLRRVARHPYARLAPSRKPDESLPLSGDGLEKVILLLRDARGVDFSDYKPATVTRRVARRMALHAIERIEDYVKYLQKNPDEVGALYEDMLINVTSFFRDPKTFDTLKEKVFPTILEGRTAREPARMWVSGCSTGEEAYSLAMCWLEAVGERGDSVPAKIFTTDVNESVIGKARAGLYPESIALDVSPERLRRFFVKVESGYQISKSVREMCVFSRHHVIKDPPFSRLDLVCCRNVLIYLESVVQKKLIPAFHYALNPGGFLMLGNSETIGTYADLFAPVDQKHKLYVKKSSAGGPGFGIVAPGWAGERRGRASRAVAESSADVRHEADRLLSKAYSPPGVLVRGDLEILQFRGHTDRFLAPAPGEASLNVLSMARPGLLPALRAATADARLGSPAVASATVRGGDGGDLSVEVRVIPVRDRESDDTYYLILFEDAAPGGERAQAAPAEGRRSRRTTKERPDAEVARLEEELEAAKEYLQSVIAQHRAATDELSAAGEEIQSANEELQSVNEELETAQEELQATNEELTTVNDELNERNIDLRRTNDDLVNLIGSIDIPVVILGPDLRIRRFTPVAEKTLSLIATDVGRPIGDLKPKLSVPDLEPVIREVLDTLRVHEQDVQDLEGRWYSMRIRPYRTAANRIEGAVLTLVDIDEARRSVELAESARDYAEAIVDTVSESRLVLEADLRVKTANQSFYRTFQVERADTEGRLVYELGNGAWNIPGLRTLLEEVLPERTSFHDYEVEQEFPRIGRRTMVLNARRLGGRDGQTALILLAIGERREGREGTAADDPR